MLGEALAAIAMLHQLIYIPQGRRLVELVVKGFSHQGSGRCMVPALSLMYLFQ
jgi:hypothetical protein